MTNRVLVVDRDGTLIVERHYLRDPRGVRLLPGVVEGLRRFSRAGWRIAVVTNQSGVGRGLFDLDDVAAVHRRMGDLLRSRGAHVDGVWICPHHPRAGCPCRKPRTLLLERAAQAFWTQPRHCLVVGDKDCDIELGRRAGARTALVRTGYGAHTEFRGASRPDLVVDDLAELAGKVLDGVEASS